jgi:hypothetical protein
MNTRAYRLAWATWFHFTDFDGSDPPRWLNTYADVTTDNSGNVYGVGGFDAAADFGDGSFFSNSGPVVGGGGYLTIFNKAGTALLNQSIIGRLRSQV